ncbi:MAG: SDR family oxidoreductase [Deltaproteobacteria bacterium]|nr:SDR family oxidoreductase [Deltaproteobacteria bacterium]
MPTTRPGRGRSCPPRRGGAGYRLSKHALARAVRRRALDWGGSGVRLDSIVPGQTDTPIYRGACEHPELGQFVDQIPVPLARTASPEEIAGVIGFTLSDAAAFIHGSIVCADGGTDAAIRPDEF